MLTKEKVAVSKTLASFFALTALLLIGFAPMALAATGTVVVSPANMNGWSFAVTDANGNPCPSCGTAQFVSGPGAPPLGSGDIGSANLATTSGHGDGSAQIITSNFNGILLSSLSSLGYWTYDTVNNGQQFPYLILSISTGLASPSQDYLFFEPPYQTPGTGSASCPDQGSTGMNTWQSWNALNGCWWDINGLASPGTGVQPLSTILAAYPNAAITGIALLVGFASPTDNFNGYVDAFTIGANSAQTVYDFEPATVVFSLPMVGSQWQLFTTHNSGQPTTFSGGVQFPFSNAAGSKPVYDRLLSFNIAASLTTSDTLAATMSIVTSSLGTAFIGNPNGGCPGSSASLCPGDVRLFFHANLPVKQAGSPSCSGGGFQANDYWWADVSFYQFVPGSSGPITLSASLSPSNWSNLCGQPGTTPGTNFGAALTKISSFGLSFGSGSFFENGVGVDGTTGTATFQLTSYAIYSP